MGNTNNKSDNTLHTEEVKTIREYTDESKFGIDVLTSIPRPRRILKQGILTMRKNDNKKHPISLIKHRPKSTEIFTMDNSHNEVLKDKQFKMVLLNLKGLKKLRDLHLIIPKTNDKDIKHLSSFLEFRTSLLSLNLNFHGSQRINNKNLSASFKNLFLLSHLCIDYSYCPSIKDRDLQNLGNGLKSLLSLKSLELVFLSNIGNNTGEAGIRRLCSDIRHIPCLTTFNLRLNNFTQLSDGHVTGIAEGLKNMTFLSNLALDFSCSHGFSIEGLKNLFEFLKDVTSLSNLNLNLTLFRRFGEAEMEEFTHGLSYLSSLTSLNLTLDDCRRIRDKELKILFQGLNSLTSLAILNLNLKSSDVSGTENEESLFELKNLSSLSNLRLDLNRSNHLCDQALERLSLDLIQIPTLSVLDLKLCYCPKISDQGLINLSNGLKQLKYLESLRLDLTGFEGITDVGAKTLFKAFECLISLVALDLEIRDWGEVTDESFKSLSSGLQNFKLFSVLKMNFHNCSKITEEGVKSLSVGLSSLKSLSMVVIVSNSSISNEAKGLFYQQIKQIESLSRVIFDYFPINENGVVYNRGTYHESIC